MRTRRFSLWEMIVAAVMIAILAMVFWTLFLKIRHNTLGTINCPDR